jgi:hypothetical protein
MSHTTVIIAILSAQDPAVFTTTTPEGTFTFTDELRGLFEL